MCLQNIQFILFSLLVSASSRDQRFLFDHSLWFKAREYECEFQQINPKLTIEVANMSDFNKQLCEQKGENHREKLLDYVKAQRPDLLMFAWCFSSNGDVCMALRGNAELSRMILEADMRKIGIEDAKLHPDQITVLEKAQDKTIKDIILTGSTGSGKTILGSEVVKVVMAQHINDQHVSS